MHVSSNCHHEECSSCFLRCVETYTLLVAIYLAKKVWASCRIKCFAPTRKLYGHSLLTRVHLLIPSSVHRASMSLLGQHGSKLLLCCLGSCICVQWVSYDYIWLTCGQDINSLGRAFPNAAGDPLQAEERTAVKQGKKPFFLKRSEAKRQELIAKYKQLKATGGLDKALQKRRRKNAMKDHRYVPATRGLQ